MHSSHLTHTLVIISVLCSVLLFPLGVFAQTDPAGTGDDAYKQKLEEYLNRNPEDTVTGIGFRTDNPYGADYGIASFTNSTDLLMWAIRFLLSLVAIVAILFIIIGGYLYITAHGDESQMEKGKKLIAGVIIGIIIIIASYTIVATLLNFGAQSST